MNRTIIAALAIGLTVALGMTAPPAHAEAAAAAAAPGWTPARIASLRHWVDSAGEDALPAPGTDELDRALAAGDPAAIERAATALALRLARLHLLGCATPAERAGWAIPDSDGAADLTVRLQQALAGDELDAFFAGLRPQGADYAALRAAYAAETDAARRTTLARNMERWRWLPQALGRTHLLVNTAAFEVTLAREGQPAQRWPVIVGRPKSPTPVFAATVTGVTFNPWWDIPPSIVRESVGALVRRNPALARQRGYVWGGGRYRQRPGPGNSLGLMKLVMPNRYNVYLHDTPTKQLFERPVRAFSHGCIRVGDALQFAQTLLDGAQTPAQVDAILAAGTTATVPLPEPIPVYIAYFTVSTRADGTLGWYPDIYGRDGRLGDAAHPHRRCAA